MYMHESIYITSMHGTYLKVLVFDFQRSMVLDEINIEYVAQCYEQFWRAEPLYFFVVPVSVTVHKYLCVYVSRSKKHGQH